MWQQPGPIYLSELIYRAGPKRATLTRYRDLVFETANLLATFAHFDRARGEYMLGPPIIPAQEVFPPLSTFNPTFELEYFRFGLWEQARGQECSAGHTAPECWNRDHPSFLAALDLLPGADVDRETMRRTLRAVELDWDLRQGWGWDFPLMAMTAARLHEPEKAVGLLFNDAPNNQFGRTGMTPPCAPGERGRHTGLPSGRGEFPLQRQPAARRRADGRGMGWRIDAGARISQRRALAGKK
jgi:hypothetical protein